ncbi:MAG: hypothetical protein JO355_05865 [Planctomycetaceae bacterium]|nr:hypothetical protein [Planctomycetaceae bacterium]MBV8556156.1 hypothetical protein [Planctomycetaceae bacterium]MBV8676681.1 hypothetical protein [Planctomycetaceae bacterium]
MKRAIALMTASVGLTALPAHAEHAKINLQVASPRDQQASFADQTPPDWGKNSRPVVRARVGDPIRVEWVLTNGYPHKTLEDVVVHFFIARQEKAGQKELPDLRGDVVLESAFEMDFKPGGKAGQRDTVRVDAPGIYLVRVETRQTQSDHEHFAAIDLVVEAKEREHLRTDCRANHLPGVWPWPSSDLPGSWR